MEQQYITLFLFLLNVFVFKPNVFSLSLTVFVHAVQCSSDLKVEFSEAWQTDGVS